MSRSPLSPYLPAASPSLSMATSAMDPDRFVAAPHEPDGGARRPAPGPARTTFGPLVWGTVMAPIKKLRDGRSTGLGWPLLNGSTQQPTERWCRRGGEVVERRFARAERVGVDV